VFSLLAHHWAKYLENNEECNMDNLSKATNYMKKAADLAAANMAQQEALDWIEKGTKLLDTVPEFEGKAKLRRSFQLQMSGIRLSTLRESQKARGLGNVSGVRTSNSSSVGGSAGSTIVGTGGGGSVVHPSSPSTSPASPQVKTTRG
jgi:hypothetical protein